MGGRGLRYCVLDCDLVTVLSDSDKTYSAQLISLCLREQSLFSEAAQLTLYPYILYSGDENIFGTLTVFRVFAEGVEVTSCRDAVTALTTAFVMFWIFDIKYPKTSASTLAFLDNFVFRKNSVAVTQKVANFINKF